MSPGTAPPANSSRVNKVHESDPFAGAPVHWLVAMNLSEKTKRWEPCWSRLFNVFFVEATVLAIACLALLSIFWSTLTLGISPMPTARKVKTEVLALLPEALSGEVHELGAGWGTLAWAVASVRPGAQVIAWERSPFPYLFCKLRSWVQPRPNLTLRFADFHEADLHRATLVLAYLWTGAMTKLGPKFEAELAPGAIVISHTFAWRGKEPEATRTASDLYRTPVYRYRISAETG